MNDSDVLELALWTLIHRMAHPIADEQIERLLEAEAILFNRLTKKGILK